MSYRAPSCEEAVSIFSICSGSSASAKAMRPVSFIKPVAVDVCDVSPSISTLYDGSITLKLKVKFLRSLLTSATSLRWKVTLYSRPGFSGSSGLNSTVRASIQYVFPFTPGLMEKSFLLSSSFVCWNVLTCEASRTRTVLSRETTPAVYASTYLAKAVLLSFTTLDWLYFKSEKALMTTIITPAAAIRVVLRAGIQLALFIVMTDLPKRMYTKRDVKP